MTMIGRWSLYVVAERHLSPRHNIWATGPRIEKERVQFSPGQKGRELTRA
jgi:hypothetical protein